MEDMPMKKTILLGLVLALAAFGLVGCDGLLSMNLFAGMEKAPKTAADIAASQDVIGDLSLAMEYGTFFDGLTADDIAALEEVLEELMNGDDVDDARAAALLYVELEMNTSEAGEVQEEAITVAGDMANVLMEGDEGVDVDTLGDTVLGLFDELDADQTLAAAESFEGAASAYEAYVETMYDAESGTYIFPEGADVMEIASTALLCALVEASGGAQAFADAVAADELTVDASTLESVAWVGNLFEALGNYFSGAGE